MSDLVQRPTGLQMGVMPRHFDDARQMCEALYHSGLLPSAIKGPAAVFAVLQTGAELGLPPMAAIRGIHIVQGRPVLAADLMVALVRRSGLCQSFRQIGSDDTQATYETHRVGEAEPQSLTYTMTQAEKAGLAKRETWKAHPAAMLRARCKAALARDVYPDVLVGVYDQDEARDFGGAVDVQVVSKASRPAPATTGGARDALMERLHDEGVSADDLLAFIKASKPGWGLPGTDAEAEDFERMFFNGGLRAFKRWRSERSAKPAAQPAQVVGPCNACGGHPSKVGSCATCNRTGTRIYTTPPSAA